MKNESDFASAIFAGHYTEDASAIQIANAACKNWCAINNALSPVIGQKGVITLIKRSLQLQRQEYPALKTITDLNILSAKFPTLHAVLIKQTTSNAVLMNNALLNTFYELLTNLIGTELTHRLLHSVLVTPSNGDPVQDTLS